ncbi:MAG: hypothetical protein Kow0069_19080 [Promethearchaeota archaeon]
MLEPKGWFGTRLGSPNGVPVNDKQPKVMGTTKLSAKEIRAMSAIEREKKLLDFRKELMILRSASAAGGATENPAKIRNLKRSIARLLTIMKESET